LVTPSTRRKLVVTIDKDFGELAVVHRLPHRGIVRLVGFSASQQGTAASDALAKYAAELSGGAIVTVERHRVRVRARRHRLTIAALAIGKMAHVPTLELNAVNQSAPAEAKIALFRSLFRGREDIYQRRFENRRTGKTGYTDRLTDAASSPRGAAAATPTTMPWPNRLSDSSRRR